MVQTKKSLVTPSGYLQRSIDSDHFVIVCWVEEDVVDVALPGSSRDDCRSSSPISSHIAVESIVCRRLVNRQTDLVKTRNFNDATTHVAMHVVVAEVRNNLAKNDDVVEAKKNLNDGN